MEEPVSSKPGEQAQVAAPAPLELKVKPVAEQPVVIGDPVHPTITKFPSPPHVTEATPE
tara:strand:- start:325 stop:501 length:177 start_codon:yes stop_codon:yes gene_type:complete